VRIGECTEPKDSKRRNRRNTMIEDGKIVCDSCKTVITQVTELPPEGWPKLHSLCSKCYAEVRDRAEPRIA
jgi:hypothetical protein